MDIGIEQELEGGRDSTHAMMMLHEGAQIVGQHHADDQRAESLLQATLEATEAPGLSANEIVDIALKAVKNLDAFGLLFREKHAWRLTLLHELADAHPQVTNHGWGKAFNLIAASVYRLLHHEKPKKSIWET